MPQAQTVECPNCHHKFSLNVDDVLRRQISEEERAKYEAENSKNRRALEAEKAALAQKAEELKTAQENAAKTVAEQVKEKLALSEQNLRSQIRKEAEAEQAQLLAVMKEQTAEKDAKLKLLREREVEFLKKNAVLEEQKNTLKLEAQKQIEAEKEKIKAAFSQQQAALDKEKEQLKTQKLEAEQKIAAQVKEQLAAKEQGLRQQLKQEAETEQAQKITALTELLTDKETKLKDLRESEANLMKAKAALQEQKDNLEAEVLKKLEAEKEKIKTEAEIKANAAYQLILAQKDKQLADSMKASEELKRKLEQGSQQMQGEVLELSLEEQLKDKFIYDEILPVPKGVNGADIIQAVRSVSGDKCGQIIWEAKNTKAWSQGWIQKLKDDQRELHGDIAILVSEALPKDVTSFAPIDGVWVCDRRFAIPLALLIREKLEAIAREKKLAIGKNEKIEMLYQYLTGNQFRQRIEAIVENFAAMQDDLIKEKRYFKKKWAATEKRLEAVLDNTAGMYGELEGIASLPKIPALELEYQTGDANEE